MYYGHIVNAGRARQMDSLRQDRLLPDWDPRFMMLCRTLVLGFRFPVSGLQLLPSGFSHLPSDFVCPRENGTVRRLNRVTKAAGPNDHGLRTMDNGPGTD